MISDQLTAETINDADTLHLFGKMTLAFDQVGSTNDIALEQAAAGATEGLLVIADEQSSGRGRLGRTWVAPAGSGLLFSMLFRPPLPPHLAGQVTMCVGLGATEGVEETTGLRPSLKWPNDLLLDGRKIGGMLSEMRMAEQTLSHVVVGLGLNVNLDLRDISEPWAGSATSLLTAIGRPVPRLPLLIAILQRTECWYARLRNESAGGYPSVLVHEAWARRLDTLGRRVEVTLSNGKLIGVAAAVTPAGALQIVSETGEKVEVWSGDVRTLRAAQG